MRLDLGWAAMPAAGRARRRKGLATAALIFSISSSAISCMPSAENVLRLGDKVEGSHVQGLEGGGRAFAGVGADHDDRNLMRFA